MHLYLRSPLTCDLNLEKGHRKLISDDLTVRFDLYMVY